MKKVISKNDIVNQARTWIGTKYHHQGRLKQSKNGQGGCDCIGFVIGVCKELNLKNSKGEMLSDNDRTNYSFIPDGVSMKKDFDENFKKISINDKLEPGDLLLLRFHKHPQHCGIVSKRSDGELGLIHCYSTVGKVVEHRLDEKWKSRIVQAYSFYSI